MVDPRCNTFGLKDSVSDKGQTLRFINNNLGSQQLSQSMPSFRFGILAVWSHRKLIQFYCNYNPKYFVFQSKKAGLLIG